MISSQQATGPPSNLNNMPDVLTRRPPTLFLIPEDDDLFTTHLFNFVRVKWRIKKTSVISPIRLIDNHPTIQL